MSSLSSSVLGYNDAVRTPRQREGDSDWFIRAYAKAIALILCCKSALTWSGFDRRVVKEFMGLTEELHRSTVIRESTPTLFGEALRVATQSSSSTEINNELESRQGYFDNSGFCSGKRASVIEQSSTSR